MVNKTINRPLTKQIISVRNGRDFIGSLVMWSWVILAIVSFFELILFFSLTNVIALSIIAFSWLLFTKIVLQPSALLNFPLSTFIIAGFVLTQLYFPALFTLIEGKPVIYNLQLPYDVFIHSFLALLVVIASHVLYRLNSKQFLRFLRTLLSKLSFFTPPDNIQMASMGIIGVFAMFYASILTKTSMEPTGMASDKFIQSLTPFTYTPFFMLFGDLYGGKNTRTTKIILFLAILTIAIFIISMGINSRSIFALSFTSIGFSYGLGLLLGLFRIPSFSWRTLLVGLLAYLAIGGPLSDLATAMVIVRGQRNDIPTSVLIEQTFTVFQDKDAIRLRRLEDMKIDRFSWDENYLNNLFLARFCNIKYNDLSLIEASKINDSDNSMLNFSLMRILTALPDPVLKSLDLTQDKAITSNYSFGDYLYAKASTGTAAIGEYRIGHFSGTGIAAFGWWYLLILGLAMLPVFALVDAFYIQTNSLKTFINKSLEFHPQFSVCILLFITSLFQFLSAESVIAPITFILRGWLQLVFTYYILFKFTQAISYFIKIVRGQFY